MPASSTAARPFIFVLAGVNGAGKSSVGGAMLADHGLTWFNPDSFARELTAQFNMTPVEANSHAWETGRAQLEAAIAGGKNYALKLPWVAELFLTCWPAQRLPMMWSYCSADFRPSKNI